MAEGQIRAVDDSQLPVINSSLTASQRLPDWTFPTTPGYIPFPFFKVGNGQCTHLTMTRLYTTEFRCSLCLRVGSMGWIYRCTQDRDLLIEDDMERGNEEKLDKLCDIFERPTSPRKRSPAARISALSFFDENNDEALDSYSPTQMNIILQQRAHANNTASKSDLDTSTLLSPPFPLIFNSLSPNPGIIPSVTPTKPSKPWLPLKGGECQFKVCHSCRPTCEVRAYLSLNGIANNDIPPSAITGFGFNLAKQRPVALVEHVKNLGLRENPPPRTSPRNTELRIPRQSTGTMLNTPLGLGILTNTELPYRSKLLPEASSSSPNKDVPNVPEDRPDVHMAFREMAARSPILHHPRPRRLGVSPHTEAHAIPLPEQTQEEIDVTDAPLTPMEELELDSGVFGSAPLEVNGGIAVTEESVDFRVADVVTQF